MGDDIGSGLSSMDVCFDFLSTNVVQLSLLCKARGAPSTGEERNVRISGPTQ